MATEDGTQGGEDSISVSGPGGLKAAASGKYSVPVLVICLLIFLGTTHHQQSVQASEQVTAQHQKIEEKFNEMIYVLSLPQPDREKLNLSMPSSLRDKTRHKHRSDDE